MTTFFTDSFHFNNKQQQKIRIVGSSKYFAFIIHMSDEFVNYTEQPYLKLILRGGISLAAKVRWPHTLESTHRP